MSAVPFERSFDDDELAALARPPRAQFADALDSAEPAEVVATFQRLERAYRNFIEGFSAFSGAVAEWVSGEHGYDALVALDRVVATTALLDCTRRGVTHDQVLDATTDGRHRAALDAALAAHDIAAALAAYDRMESSLRIVHDTSSVRVAAALSHVYRAHGVDALEACIAHAGDRSLLQFRPRDVVRPAERRVRQWAGMMLGNFATIGVEEHGDRFVITQDPCGTCTRQVLDGCYSAPVDLAVVTERGPLTFFAGDTPVYRTHVAVMHYLQPMAVDGRPWPVIECPSGMGTGPCRITLYKDHESTPADAGDRVRR